MTRGGGGKFGCQTGLGIYPRNAKLIKNFRCTMARQSGDGPIDLLLFWPRREKKLSGMHADTVVLGSKRKSVHRDFEIDVYSIIGKRAKRRERR